MTMAPHPDTLNARYPVPVPPPQPPVPKGGLMRRLFSALGRLKVLLLGIALLGIFLVSTAATDATTNTANAIVTFAAVVVLPIALKFVKLSGAEMAAVAYAATFVIAVIAGLISGELNLSALNGGSFGTLLAFATTLYGVQQVVFQLVKDNATLGKLVA